MATEYSPSAKLDGGLQAPKFFWASYATEACLTLWIVLLGFEIWFPLVLDRLLAFVLVIFHAKAIDGRPGIRLTLLHTLGLLFSLAIQFLGPQKTLGDSSLLFLWGLYVILVLRLLLQHPGDTWLKALAVISLPLAHVQRVYVASGLAILPLVGCLILTFTLRWRAPQHAVELPRLHRFAADMQVLWLGLILVAGMDLSVDKDTLPHYQRGRFTSPANLQYLTPLLGIVVAVLHGLLILGSIRQPGTRRSLLPANIVGALLALAFLGWWMW